MITDIPKAKIKQRVINKERESAALDAGLDPILARIIASRPFHDTESLIDLLSPKLKSLDHPQALGDIDKAVQRLVKAIVNQEIIGIETDHDCDGQTSHAVIYCALTEYFAHPSQKIRSYIGHRLKEGYGLSSALAQRILADEPQPTLIITADNGSADEERIQLLKQKGIDVIVTDHHEIPSEGIPESAYAVINPTRVDCNYPDRYIAGCMVAWLFMAATRQALMAYQTKEIPSLSTLLDFVAVGTIADCVSIARSRNNRAVVHYGMKLIQQGLRPCWRVLLTQLSLPLSSEDIGFKIGPLLNSDGRLACAFGSVSFLLAKTDDEAKQWVEHLQQQNAERKVIQDKVTQLALQQAKVQYQDNKIGLCLFLEEGHAGVHGISASRIKDLFGRPVILFCPKADDPSYLTGSGRSIDGLHLRDVLQEIHNRNPDMLVRFGGHQGAAGLSIHRHHLAAFAALFDDIVREQVTIDMIDPVIWTDGEFPIDLLNVSVIDKLVSKLEPFGREFEPPLFETQGKILSIDIIGQSQTHARLGLMIDEMWFEAVWFNCRQTKDHPMPIEIGTDAKIVFAPKLQTFRGQRKLNCQIVHVEPLFKKDDSSL